ncbi:hypothetical protein [Sorangium sp. So ce887]|uniref:hypothetical protein n=1 Tax=Sorangium sp. So ce887 TaxID=3133324 RepID=UPI003F6455FC
MKLLGFLMAGLALVACGDDDGDTTGTTSTTSTSGSGGNGGTDGTGGNGGTDGTGGETGDDLDGKQLDTLTGEEAQALCDELAASADFSKEDSCELIGMVAAALGGDCEAAKEECMSDPETPAEPGTCPAEDFEGCTATVGEFKTCTNAQIEFIKALTCETPPDTSEEALEGCEAISEKCPELLGGGTEGEGGGEGA